MNWYQMRVMSVPVIELNLTETALFKYVPLCVYMRMENSGASRLH